MHNRVFLFPVLPQAGCGQFEQTQVLWQLPAHQPVWCTRSYIPHKIQYTKYNIQIPKYKLQNRNTNGNKYDADHPPTSRMHKVIYPPQQPRIFSYTFIYFVCVLEEEVLHPWQFTDDGGFASKTTIFYIGVHRIEQLEWIDFPQGYFAARGMQQHTRAEVEWMLPLRVPNIPFAPTLLL